jgi:hypothetical protein
MVSKCGMYDMRSTTDQEGEWLLNIEVYNNGKNGILRFINPNNKTECAVKGMIGWQFKKRKTNE